MKGGGGRGRENVWGEDEIDGGEVMKSEEDVEDWLLDLGWDGLLASGFTFSSMYGKKFILDFSRRGVEGRLGGK